MFICEHCVPLWKQKQNIMNKVLHGDCLEKGTKLIAINPCEMSYNGEKALIVGKEYTVLRIDVNNPDGSCVVIQSEFDDSHYFPTAELKDFFTFPENNPENRL